MLRPRKPASPFRYFNSAPEVIRLVVLMHVRFSLSLRNVEDLLFERGIDVCHETVRLWWNRFGPMFAADIRRQRGSRMKGFRHWRAVDHEGEVLEKLRHQKTGQIRGFAVLEESAEAPRAARVRCHCRPSIIPRGDARTGQFGTPRDGAAS